MSSQNIPGCEKCILASLEFPFFTHGEVSTEICITNAHFISRIPQKKAVCWRRTNMFSSLNLFHSQRYYRNLWPRGFLEAGQEWSHKHLPQKCETFFLFKHRTRCLAVLQNHRALGLTNRLIEYCEFVIMSILLFLGTLTFKLFLGHGQNLQVLWCLSVFFKNFNIYIRTKIFFFGGKLIQGKQAVKAVFPEMFVHCLLIHQLTKST